VTHLSHRTGRTPDLDECHRALRTAMHNASGGGGSHITTRVLAAQLGWRLARTEAALTRLEEDGRAKQSTLTGGWYAVEAE